MTNDTRDKLSAVNEVTAAFVAVALVTFLLVFEPAPAAPIYQPGYEPTRPSRPAQPTRPTRPTPPTRPSRPSRAAGTDGWAEAWYVDEEYEAGLVYCYYETGDGQRVTFIAQDGEACPQTVRVYE